MKDWLKEYFYYTRAERSGALILGSLALLLFVLPLAYPYYFDLPPAEHQAFTEEVNALHSSQAESAPEADSPSLFYFDPNTLPIDSLMLLGLPRSTANTIVKYRTKVRPFREVEDLLKIFTLSESDYERIEPYVRIAAQPAATSKSAAREEALEPQLFPFDPNTLSGDSLLLLGMPARIARNLIKYREKGGRFKKPEDLQKLYGLSQADYERLLPHVAIAPSTAAEPEQAWASQEPDDRAEAPEAEIEALDINRASPEEWQRLRGIGPSYARRICGFRDKLGGFASVEQVGTTYGLPDSTFQSILPKLQLSPVLRRLAINQADATTLKAHPYLNWKHANAIIAYRSQHGPFRSAEEVANIRALPDGLAERMAPYWSFE